MESAWGIALPWSDRGASLSRASLEPALSCLLEMCDRRSPVVINESAQSCGQLAWGGAAVACLDSHRVGLVFHACNHAKLNAGAIEVVVVAADLEVNVSS